MNLRDDLIKKVEASGFTMTAVCDRAGVSSGTPSAWAAGVSSPTQSTYDRMIAALTAMVKERDQKIKAAGIA